MKNLNITELSIFDFLEKDAASEKISQKIVDEQICLGSGFVNGKYRIYKWFSQQHTVKENTCFLADEYGIGGWSTDFGYVEYNTKGLTLWKYKGVTLCQKHSLEMSWSEVANRIEVLISLNKYMNSKEMEDYEKIQYEI